MSEKVTACIATHTCIENPTLVFHEAMLCFRRPIHLVCESLFNRGFRELNDELNIDLNSLSVAVLVASADDRKLDSPIGSTHIYDAMYMYMMRLSCFSFRIFVSAPTHGVTSLCSMNCIEGEYKGFDAQLQDKFV